MTLSTRASKIKILILDIDGVLTDGKIYYDAAGNVSKAYNIRDGHGLILAHRAGLIVGAITGRGDPCNRARAHDLAFDFLFESCKDKSEAFETLLKQYHVSPDECAYVGDDVVDMTVMRKCGLAVAVGDAHEGVLTVAHMQTKANGGCGAVREVIELLIREQGKWDAVMGRYY